MNKGFLALACLAGTSASSFATIVLSDNFNSYTNGNLSTQGGWTATAAALTPMQVSSGAVLIGTSGQDEYKALSSSVAATAGTSIYAGFDITVTAAQTSGDYFFHFSDPVGTASNFYGRLFAKSNGAGNFLLGFANASGGATTTYGTTNLTIGQTYRIVLGWNFVASTLNDTFNLYVNPSDTSVEGNNTGYISTYTWGGTTAEPANVSAVNLRQGGATASASVTFDNLTVATTFIEVAAVPEPSTFVTLFGGIGMLMGFRRLRRTDSSEHRFSSLAPLHPGAPR